MSQERQELSEKERRLENLKLAFQMQYDPGDPPPWFNLMLFVGSSIYEPVDWAIGTIETIALLAQGNLGGAALNAILTYGPGLKSWWDNALKRASGKLDNGLQPRYALADGFTQSGNNNSLNRFNFSDADAVYNPRDHKTRLDANATRDNAIELSKSLKAAMGINESKWKWRVPEDGEAPHHIVPSTAAVANEARGIMILAGVNVNSAYNGIGINRDFHAKYLNILPQGGGKGNAYVDALNIAFGNLPEIDGRVAKDQVVKLLDEVAKRLDSLSKKYVSGNLEEEDWNTFINWIEGYKAS